MTDQLSWISACWRTPGLRHFCDIELSNFAFQSSVLMCLNCLLVCLCSVKTSETKECKMEQKRRKTNDRGLFSECLRSFCKRFKRLQKHDVKTRVCLERVGWCFISKVVINSGGPASPPRPTPGFTQGGSRPSPPDPRTFCVGLRSSHSLVVYGNVSCEL